MVISLITLIQLMKYDSQFLYYVFVFSLFQMSIQIYIFYQQFKFYNQTNQLKIKQEE